MFRRLLTALALTAPVAAQAATITPYGQPCPGTVVQIPTTGLPSLGTTFVVGDPAVGASNPCGPFVNCTILYFTLVGATPAGIPFPFAWGGNCLLLVDPFDIVNTGGLTIAVPNNTGLIGAQVYFQRMFVIVNAGVANAVFSSAIAATVGL